MSGEVEGKDAARIAELAAELDVLRLDDRAAPSGIATLMAPLTELLGAETAVVYGLARRGAGWAVERWDVAGALATPRAEALFRALFADGSSEPVFYDPLLPAPEIRDRVFEARAWIDAVAPDAWHASRMCEQLLAPLGMAEHEQLRALVCEGPTLLGWFGIVHPAPTTARQHAILTALLPAVRRRLSLERRLASASRQAAALDVALAQMGSAVFVLSAQGQIFEANALARALFDTQRAEVTAALHDALAGRPHALAFELVPLAAPGAPRSWLAILRGAPRPVRIAAAVGAAAGAWTLTTRQRQVLELVVEGHANATIAALLRVSSRTVELHVTALLDRAGVGSRAALVTRVLVPES